MGSPNKKGAGATAGATGGGLLVLCRCLHHSIIVGRKKRRNGRGRFSGRCSLRSGRCSLRSGRWHARLLLAALVGALCFPDALGGSDGEGLLCPTRCARRCNSCHHTCGRSAVCCQRVYHRGPKPPYLSSSLQMPSDMVRGCERGCVEELCWLFFVPCEQSAPMCVLLRTPEQ